MNKFFKWSIFLIFVVITFIRVLNHHTYVDEARAWLIAEHLNLFEIFDLMKTEGHTFVWYVLLMPFAKLHFAYPYSMLILNWLFCVGALFVLWKFSPFNTFTKTVITFSAPFFVCYPILARCYAVGIFLLFTLTALFKNKSKIPIIYSVLILLTANTSVVAIGGALAFAVLLWFELFKNKQYKDFGLSLCIGLFCFILLCMQLFGANPAITGLKSMLLGLNFDFFANVFIFPHFVNLILLTIFVIATTCCLLKSKISLIFLSVTYLFLLSVFHFVYLGFSYHHYFFFVYFIIALWLFSYEENKSDLYEKNLTSILILVSLFYCADYRFQSQKAFFNSGSKILFKKIMNISQNGQIVFVGKGFFQLLPYIEEKNINFYYAHTLDKITNPMLEEKNIPKVINPNVIAEIYKKNKNVYCFILDNEKPLDTFIVETKNGFYIFELQEVFGNHVYIFKVNKM